MQTQKNKFQIEEMQKMALIGTWEWELATNKLYWSEELFNIFGLNSNSFVPTLESFRERVHSDDADKAKNALDKLFLDKKPIDYDIRIFRPDNSIRYLECKAKAILDESENIVFVIGLCQDITEKKLVSNILDNIDDGFYSLDPNWNFTYINNKAEQILGISKGTIIGKNVWEQFPESINNKSYQYFHESVEQKQTKEFELFNSSQLKWFSVRVFPSKMGLSIYFHDITDKVKAHEKLKEEESRFKLLIEAMPQIAWIGNSAGQIEYFNPAWYRYTGIESETPEDWNWSGIIPSEDVATVLTIWNQALKNNEKFELKIRFRGIADGIFRWHLCRGLPLINEQGEVTKWFGVCTDIDEEVRSEQTQKFLAEAGELLISSIDYKTTLENISKIAVPQFADWCAVDMVQDNKIVRLAVTHQDPVKIEMAKEFVKRYPPSLDAPTGLANVIRTGKTEYMKEIPEALYDSVTDEVLKDFAVKLNINSFIIVPLKLQGKAIGGITFVNHRESRLFDERDIKLAEDVARRASLALENAELYTQSQKAKFALENTNRELEQFAYVASHDLQEPLRTTSSYAMLLKKRFKDKLDESGDTFLDMIIDASKRMKNLIDDLLDYSKVGKNDIQSVDLNNVLEKIRFNLDLSMKENNAIIESETLPVIKAYQTQMLQLFQNLISNSLKYRSESNPIIKISVKKQDNFWLFSFADNGMGIEKQYFDKIFVIFQRLHNRHEYEGTGIGLATCKKILEMHNGNIWLESEIGKGTTFYFTIPV